MHFTLISAAVDGQPTFSSTSVEYLKNILPGLEGPNLFCWTAPLARAHAAMEPSFRLAHILRSVHTFAWMMRWGQKSY